MSKLNPPIKSRDLMETSIRLAGGFGSFAARQDAVSLLKRVVMANMLWEDIAYIDGKEVTDQIVKLVPKCSAESVYDIALSARLHQKLRHTPLLLAVEMCRYPQHARVVSKLLPQIITRADMITDFLALYWSRNAGKKSISHQVARGLAEAFHNFDEYQFAKYDRDAEVKLRDVMFLCHPTPRDEEEKEVFRKIAERNLDIPDTWEVALSTGIDKKATWERLVSQGKLGGLAFLRNLRSMRRAKVSSEIINMGLQRISTSKLLPFDFLKAYRMNPDLKDVLEESMLKSLRTLSKLRGRSLLILDVSGSMVRPVSYKSDLTRLDCAVAMAILASEICEDFDIVCTAGYDSLRVGSHEHIKYPHRGFALMKQVQEVTKRIGYGGIFTRQCLEWCENKFAGEERFERIIVFSDSQDCDFPDRRIPKPFASFNYICDISCEKHGIAYNGVWTAEISGFSEHFLSYIAAMEQL